MSTSFPDGDPFTDLSAAYVYTPRSTATPGVATANENLTSTSTYSSTVTFVDPQLSIQTVTITILPASQTPTSISTNQTFGVTTGVSLLWWRPGHSLTDSVHHHHAGDWWEPSSAAFSNQYPVRLIGNHPTSR